MMRATQFANYLERSWRQRRYNAHNIPWHLCLITLMAGIIAGNLWGPYRPQSLHEWFDIGGVLGLMLLMAVCMIGLVCTWLQSRKHGNLAPRRYTVIFTLFWCLLWLIVGNILGCPVRPHTPPSQQICQIEATIEMVEPGMNQITANIHRWHCENTAGTGNVRVRMPMNPDEFSLKQTPPTLFRGMTFQTEGWFETYASPDVPGMFDAKFWAQTAGLEGRFKRQGKRKETGYMYAPIQVISAPYSRRAMLETWRRLTYEKLAAISPDGILPALVLGSSRQLSEDTRLTFGRLGIAHVLSVSGLHFGLIAMALQFIFTQIFGHIPFIMRRFGKNRAATAVALPGLAIYLLFVGAPISAQRSLVMVAVSTMARLANRRSERTRALCMAGILILIHDPVAVFAISFQLSFAAVLGLIWGSDLYDHILKLRIKNANLPEISTKLAESSLSTLIMTIATSLTTAPFVLWHFGQLPILGTLTNLIVIPYTSFILMPLAIATAIWVTADLPLASIIIKITQYSETFLTQFAEIADQIIPLNCIDVPPNPVTTALASVTAIALLFKLRLKPWRLSCAVIAACLMTASLVLSQTHPRFWHQTDDLIITFVAMGQADATLIEFPNGKIMLIDAGSELGRTQNSTQTRLIPYLKTQGIRHIDTLVLTHSDYDHVAGIQPLLAHTTIGEIWHNGFTPENDPQFWENLMPNHTHLMHDVTQMPQQHTRDEASLKILWPTRASKSQLEAQNALNPNEMSIVLHLQYGQFSALFMGDAGIPAEDQIRLKTTVSPVTVIKAGHHGSKSASSQNWINHTLPKLAVFSTGFKNRYHFPHTAVQRRFHQAQTQLYRTDRHGTVQITTDGKHMRIQTMHP